MIFTPTLQKARFLRRYKRFLADVQLPDGTEMTVHCPNTGSMRECLLEGSDCWLLKSDNPKRKYAWTWQLATTPSLDIACINTHMANAVVAEALAQKHIAELAHFGDVRPEVKYGDGSRIDFLLTEGKRQCYLEVKSVTLLEQGQGYFPDAKSTRGQKHLQELMTVKRAGFDATLLFCVMHSGITSVAPAIHIDPKYSELLADAAASGVQILAYGTNISALGIELAEPMPVIIKA